MRRSTGFIACFLMCVSAATAQVATEVRSVAPPQPKQSVTVQLLWLIESDDANRVAYEGPARSGLASAGFNRLVPAGSAMVTSTVGQPTTISGSSRYGQLSTVISVLNTTELNQVQVKLGIKTRNDSPLEIDTTIRVPLDRWSLVGSSDSRVAIPKHHADGKRGVVIMKVMQGPMLLD